MGMRNDDSGYTKLVAMDVDFEISRRIAGINDQELRRVFGSPRIWQLHGSIRPAGFHEDCLLRA